MNNERLSLCNILAQKVKTVRYCRNFLMLFLLEIDTSSDFVLSYDVPTFGVGQYLSCLVPSVTLDILITMCDLL